MILSSGVGMCAWVLWVFVGVDEDVAVVVCKCARNVEAFLGKNGYCILPISKQKGQMLVVCNSSRFGERFSIASSLQYPVS